MNVPWWVAELATAFWEQAGGPEPFPRALREPAVSALPLTIVTRPALSTCVVREWFQRRDLTYPLPGADRRLRGCLFARNEGGVIFLDGSDDAAEQRFSLAHELAHFLRHYWDPRRQACERLGGAILEVFDGRRAPRLEERLRAALAGVTLGYHVHLTERDARRRAPPAITAAEAEADQLAYELLAPAAAVAERLGPVRDRATAAALLRDSFGLPAAPAADYAAFLLPDPPADPVLRWLGLPS